MLEVRTKPSNEYVITFDIDWAPDSSIIECLKLLESVGAKATFFTTHYTELNSEIILRGHELGIHPNFLPNSSHGKNLNEIIDNCLKFAPKASIIRTHSLVQSSPMLYEIFSNYPQLKLDVSLCMHKAEHAQKVPWSFAGVKFDRIMYNWEDDFEFETKQFSDKDQKFFGKLTIFNFHPIHVHLNSSDGTEYSRLKSTLGELPLYKAEKKLIEKMQNTDVGVKSFFKAVLDSKIRNIALSEV